MKCFNVLCGLLLVLATGCQPNSPASKTSDAAIRTFDARGVVRQITPDRHTATIQHEAIPGFMPAMTMDFTVPATNELNGIAPDDEIAFKLVVRENDSWIEDIRFVSHRIENVTNSVFVFHVATAEMKPGELLPDYELMAEDGKLVRFADFRGGVLAFTFFFTRCPLPDFCPRMNKDFSEARQLLMNTPGTPTNWQLLSISFDPGFDQPSVLAGYANYFREGRADRWLFATASTNTLADLAPRLDLAVTPDGPGFSHNLRTVVLDPQGCIFKIFKGNNWTAQQLADAMLAAARQPTTSTPP